MRSFVKQVDVALTLSVYYIFTISFSFSITGDPVFRRDRAVPEDRSVCQEGWLHARLHLPAAKHHAHQPRAGHSVLPDAGAG